MKVYSPSATTTFAQCPMKWFLSRARGIKPRVLTKGLLAAELGTLISFGMEKYHKSVLFGSGNPEQEAMEHMEQVWTNNNLHTGNRVIPNDLEAELEELPQRAVRAVQALIKAEPVISGAWTIDAELVLHDFGNARIDLLLGTNEGPAVVDYKSKVSVNPYYREITRQDYEHSWQMYHYVWSLRKMGHNVTQFMIVLVVITPKPKVYKWPYDVNETYLQHWEHSAKHYWSQMERVDTGDIDMIPMATDHRSKFGLCEYFEHCTGDRGAYGDVDEQIFIQRS